VTINTSAKTVGLTASSIILVENFASAAKDGRITYEVYNNGSATIYLGGTSGVTTSTGIPIPPKASRTLDLRLGANIYAISGTAGQDVRVMEVI
jgi:hypothetical protein